MLNRVFSPNGFIIALLALAFSVIAVSSFAYADELDDKKASLEEKTAAVESAIAECEENQAAIDELQGKIDSLLTQIDELHVEKAKTSEEFGKYAVIAYKVKVFDVMQLLLASDDIGELIRNYDYILSCLDRIGDVARQQSELEASLQSEYDGVSAEKDELDALQEELNASKDAIQSEVDALRGEISELQIKKFEESLSAFPTGDTTGWRSGPASGYGGYGDASIADNQRTATGAAVTEYSMGVAIPMAWGNTRSYYGKKVEISYNGKSVIATINDCGGMNGGQRHLDLQPGVFRAFGFDNCNSWGVRTVKYRFLD